MPSIKLTVTAGAADQGAGKEVGWPLWSAGFDHASLVAAMRSRADGHDIHLTHTEMGPVKLTAHPSGPNTANCRVSFILVANIPALTADNKYRLNFGNLGAVDPATVSVGLGPVVGSCVADAIPALTLPHPGFSLDREDDHDVDEMAYPDVLSPRGSLRNQNDRPEFIINWRNISAEEWYEIRAFWNAYRGGAGFWTDIPSWLSSVPTERFRCVALAATQHTRASFSASMTVERVAA